MVLFNSNIGGIAYELGKPLLNFICYEPERFDEGFSSITEAFEVPGANEGRYAPEFLTAITQNMTDFQKSEIYVYFYAQELMSAVYSDCSPRQTFELLSADFKKLQKFIVHEIEVLLHYREKVEVSKSIDYIDILDEYHYIKGYEKIYLEKSFRTFYGRVADKEVVQLYEIDSIEDLFRFEFIKMIEHDIFIKKCKNCERFFIPKRRSDVEYCDRLFGDTGRKCSEIGATLRYEQKIAGNPVLEAHKRAYRRLHSRVRAKKLSQSEFLKWSEEASRLRDLCLSGELGFDEFREWLEIGRVRRGRGNKN